MRGRVEEINCATKKNGPQAMRCFEINSIFHASVKDQSSSELCLRKSENDSNDCNALNGVFQRQRDPALVQISQQVQPPMFSQNDILKFF